MLLAGATPGGDDSGVEADADGDGFPSWRTTRDPELADCDDHDSEVGPATERFVAGGAFLRGQDGLENASPRREIHLSPYCIDRFEVAVELYAAGIEGVDDYRAWYDFDDDDDIVPPRLAIDEEGKLEVVPHFRRHPITEVWHDTSEAWCARFGKRLPTEAEWEKAARGGCELDGDPTCGADDARAWPWGDVPPTCATANYATGAGLGTPCVFDTVDVGSYPQGVSPYGVHDLAGNAAEWVADWYREDYYADSPSEDPAGPDTGWARDDLNPDGFEARTARGGNYITNGDFLRVYSRMFEPATATSNGLGFRCARALGDD